MQPIQQLAAIDSLPSHTTTGQILAHSLPKISYLHFTHTKNIT